ncbi:MAG TPA: alpha/beta fold hydrolase [Mycobacteriales bacterium]|nr:alpha/beta fold hydrolase [Mycobacteriales bacterium]
MSVEREKVRFVSGGTECVAWHYPGSNGACVVMAGGFAVPRGPATDLFATQFHNAGFGVLAFDYRGVGESGGQPLVLPIRRQLEDWQAALDFARTLPGVDASRISIWGFSASGGHIFRVAARNPQLTAAIAQTPNADGVAGGRNAAQYQKPLAMLRFTGRGILDVLGSLVGRPPRIVALTGPPGTVSMLTTPDSLDGDRALNADRYPEWRKVVATRSALRLTTYRPGRLASQIRCPLLVVVCDQDQTSPAGPAVKAANRAPRGELVRMPGGHYEPFLDGHEQAAATQISFLRRHLLVEESERQRGARA